MNPHTSVSQMNTFWKCAMQWYLRKTIGPVPSSAFQHMGKGGHAAIEKNLTHKIETGVLLGESDVTDIARDAVNSEWEKEPPQFSDEDKESAITSKGAAVDKAVNLSRVHHNIVAPYIRPLADVLPNGKFKGIEREWRLETPLGVDITGVIDICEGESAGWKIRDTKFKGKSPTAGEVAGSLQFTGYHLALSVLDKHDCALQMDALVQTKTKRYFKAVPTARNGFDHQDFLNRLWLMQEAIRKGVFLPCQRDHWACSEKWCGYFNDDCPYGRKGRERVTA